MRRWLAALLAVVVAGLGSPAPALAQSSDAFTVATDAASPARTATLSRLTREHGAGSISVVRLNPEVFRSAVASSAVMFNLSGAVRLNGVTRPTMPLGGGRTLWQGDIAGAGTLPAGNATIAVDGGSATGTIVEPDGARYQLRPIGDGTHAVIKLDYAKLPKEDPEAHPRYYAQSARSSR